MTNAKSLAITSISSLVMISLNSRVKRTGFRGHAHQSPVATGTVVWGRGAEGKELTEMVWGKTCPIHLTGLGIVRCS